MACHPLPGLALIVIQVEKLRWGIEEAQIALATSKSYYESELTAKAETISMLVREADNADTQSSEILGQLQAQVTDLGRRNSHIREELGAATARSQTMENETIRLRGQASEAASEATLIRSGENRRSRW